MLDLFQSRCPVTTKVMNFVANKELCDEVCSQYFSHILLPHELKTKVLNQVRAAFSYADEKLSKYMQYGQPDIEFLSHNALYSWMTAPTATKPFLASPQCLKMR